MTPKCSRNVHTGHAASRIGAYHRHLAGEPTAGRTPVASPPQGRLHPSPGRISRLAAVPGCIPHAYLVGKRRCRAMPLLVFFLPNGVLHETSAPGHRPTRFGAFGGCRPDAFTASSSLLASLATRLTITVSTVQRLSHPCRKGPVHTAFFLKRGSTFGKHAHAGFAEKRVLPDSDKIELEALGSGSPQSSTRSLVVLWVPFSPRMEICIQLLFLPRA